MTVNPVKSNKQAYIIRIHLKCKLNLKEIIHNGLFLDKCMCNITN